MKTIFYLVVCAVCIFGACSNSNQSEEGTITDSGQFNPETLTESVQSQPIQEINTQNEELSWNYSGSIGKYPIKAQINYGEGVNSEGTGALQIPITGYYFYKSKNQKIPIEGMCNGSGTIYFVAHTNGGDETFEGQFSESMLEDFSGTWFKGSKQLDYFLNSN